ncbi:cytochrome c oxidase accessory protein CcoG [Botrimarina sp.]|uniref:cytochrome c oxidase accessory protein CcoG n=1 Tax=Botrimarina sp. TaxID=2795802 RepID=UPI0032EC541C
MNATNELPVLPPEERVLSTLDNDGRRRWLYPKLSTGRFWSRRRLVAYLLIAVYASLPFVKINGRPAMQLDLWNGRVNLLGLQFRPTDMELLAVFGVTVFLSIFCLTAVFGRVWCGWACPQTVYLEFVFRPIERLFTGTTGKGGKPKKAVAGWRVVAMYAAFALISWHLANTFLAYFVGVDALNEWIWTQPPWRHPAAFALVLFVTGLMLFDFCYWREQLCIIGCPYGRFQSVMLDQSSLIVGYDYRRGEPRGHGRDREAKGLGDCVDCHQCVAVCPTGIDIRDGLQLECVNCTQCIDACDAVMDRVGLPRGLIRYSSQSALEGEPTRIVRPRVVIYGVLITVLAALLVTLLATRTAFDATLLRGLGQPFALTQDARIENRVRVKLVNRTDEPQTYTLGVVSPDSVEAIDPPSPRLAPGESVTETLHLVAPPEAFYAAAGRLEVRLRIEDSQGESMERPYQLYGPVAPPAAAAEREQSDD